MPTFLTLSPYACDPLETKGRLYKEDATLYRNEFERDRDRVIHSNAFRRLQYKTQVFVNHEGDHYRNRLTHSVEVSSIARSVAKALNLSEDLAESVGLAHDLGHSPFGHAGEEALNEVMKDYGGFSHNAHSLKILTKLEKRYAAYDGLNLTWEVVEGIVKHNGPLIQNVPEYILEYNKINDLDLKNYSSAEAQLASLSDDIAYICHDLEDGIRSSIINFDDLSAIDILDQFIIEVRKKFHQIEDSRLIYEVVRKLTHYLIGSLLFETKKNLQLYRIETINDIRLLGKQLVDFTDIVKNEISDIKKFLFSKIYKHEHVASVNSKAKKIVKELFEFYMNNVKLLPQNWYDLIIIDKSKKASIISDYIAGMSDRFAIIEYEKYYNVNFNDIKI